MSSEEYYEQGNLYRRSGNFSAAMNCYMEAVHLNAESPAAEALEMLREIMNFYCKDIYNP